MWRSLTWNLLPSTLKYRWSELSSFSCLFISRRRRHYSAPICVAHPIHQVSKEILTHHWKTARHRLFHRLLTGVLYRSSRWNSSSSSSRRAIDDVCCLTMSFWILVEVDCIALHRTAGRSIFLLCFVVLRQWLIDKSNASIVGQLFPSTPLAFKCLQLSNTQRHRNQIDKRKSIATNTVNAACDRLEWNNDRLIFRWNVNQRLAKWSSSWRRMEISRKWKRSCARPIGGHWESDEHLPWYYDENASIGSIETRRTSILLDRCRTRFSRSRSDLRSGIDCLRSSTCP